MRRPVPWIAVSVGLLASLVLALLVGSSVLPAAGRPTKPEANRFAPSGVVGVDPDAAATRRRHRQGAGGHRRRPRGGSVPGPSVSGTSGCNDVDATNVRVNQECTNQSDAAFLGRGQGQNETAVAVNPKNSAPPAGRPERLPAGRRGVRRRLELRRRPPLGQRAGPAQLHRAWLHPGPPLLGRLRRPVGGVRLLR